MTSQVIPTGTGRVHVVGKQRVGGRCCRYYQHLTRCGAAALRRPRARVGRERYVTVMTVQRDEVEVIGGQVEGALRRELEAATRAVRLASHLCQVG